MKSILEFIEQKKQAYQQLPLFAFMQDATIEPKRRLAFAPCMAHFIMSFGDLNKYVFRSHESLSPLQNIVNEHTYEDDHHYPWFLTDLHRLGLNGSKGFVETLRFLWGDETKITRQLSYQLAAYTFHAEPIYKIAVIEAIEATGNVLFSLTSAITQVLQDLNQQEYQYFGQFHFNLENGHAAKSLDSEQLLGQVVLSETEQAIAIELVEKVFDIFTAWTYELLAYAQNEDAVGQFTDVRTHAHSPTPMVHARNYLSAS
ncbi:hypothetical protein ACN4EG_12800 [Alkalinema pantanalense CENA528]|uniref:hypothetical protein n=1 Tax=Alkalinema pantanalense TaxID=1620705 RepID=UPI003D6E950E